jgi:hypothetical protein
LAARLVALTCALLARLTLRGLGGLSLTLSGLGRLRLLLLLCRLHLALAGLWLRLSLLRQRYGCAQAK